jgi:hypothetical protein
MAGRLFDLVVMADWSAAERRGPKRPAPDRCWVAWGGGGDRPEPRYFRTRAEAVRFIRDLLLEGGGNALVGFDFPYGFPRGSGLGGGRKAATRLHAGIRDEREGANNRFEVAARLNAKLNEGRPGPFWGCPASKACATLTRTLRGLDLDRARFPEYRIVEERLRAKGHRLQSVWKLAYPGSVGSQTLLGLPALYRLLTEPALQDRSVVWPFETGWDKRLAGIVHAEIWPSLRDFSAQPHPIRDARQVMELRDWACEEDARGTLGGHLARPKGLTPAEAAVCLSEEGWILGADDP